MDANEYFVAKQVAEAVVLYNPLDDKHITSRLIDREWQSIAQKFDNEFAGEDADNELQESKYNFTSFIVFKPFDFFLIA